MIEASPSPRPRSTFYWAMRLMPQDRRAAMFAIYDLARALDDVADGTGSTEEKRAALASWKKQIAALYAGAPTHALTRSLLPVLQKFEIPRREFEELIAGMEMDVDGPINAPPAAMLDLYCRRVAGSVGLLSLPVFGADGPAEQEFALYLARALQLTNILRDFTADAAIGRLYMPREYLSLAGVTSTEPPGTLRDPRFRTAVARLSADATDAFARADAVLEHCNRPALWPALAMMGAYRALLRRVEREPVSSVRISLGRLTALRAAACAAIQARM